MGTSPKSASTALLLCLFLGMFGAHRFYVGKIGTGFLMLLTMGGLGIWTLTDLINISICEFTDKEGLVLEFRKVSGSPIKYTLKILGAIAACFIISIAIIYQLAIFATMGMVEVVNQQLDAFRKGDVVLAYTYMSKDFQRAQSYDNFRGYVSVHPELAESVNVTFTDREMINGRGILFGTIYAKNGKGTAVEYRLIKEDDIWKIQGFLVSSPPEKESIGKTAQKAEKKPVLTEKDVSLPNKFSSPHDLYTINYPANWEFEKLGNGSMIFSGKRNTPYYYTTVNIQVILSKKDGGMYKTLGDFVKDMKTQIMQDASNVKMVEESDLQFTQDGKNYAAHMMVFSFNYNENRMMQQMIMIYNDKNDTFYGWAYTTLADQYQNGLPVAKAMYNTWKLGK